MSEYMTDDGEQQMKRRAIWSAIPVMVIALCLLAQPAFATNKSAIVTGVGGSAFPAGTTFGGLTLTSYRFGVGVSIAADGTATGDFEITLLGTYQGAPWTGSVVCKASAGTLNPSGAFTFSGTCYIDMGGVSPPSSAAFSSSGKDKQNLLTLTVGSTTWQVATGTNGSITTTLY
jgi:hypothetical protein